MFVFHQDQRPTRTLWLLFGWEFGVGQGLNLYYSLVTNFFVLVHYIF